MVSEEQIAAAGGQWNSALPGGSESRAHLGLGTPAGERASAQIVGRDASVLVAPGLRLVLSSAPSARGCPVLRLLQSGPRGEGKDLWRRVACDAAFCRILPTRAPQECEGIACPPYESLTLHHFKISGTYGNAPCAGCARVALGCSRTLKPRPRPAGPPRSARAAGRASADGRLLDRVHAGLGATVTFRKWKSQRAHSS